ncbi:MAG: ChbG/HpnK family deacetylase, partial [Alphaproteobacteria bacterium]|nr:ChbG/HpnK family deacetylase [Alphaproteobacteria bacterium]
MKIIINADDFGMNDGVNAAVERAFRRGCLNSASLMPFAQSAAAAFKIARDNPGLAVGLHADFDRGFIMMMIDWIFRREKFKKWIEQKLRAQIQECARHGVKHLSHLDSHRNVHMIPAVFSVFKNLAAEYKIPRVRVVNENFFLVIFDNPGFDWIKTGAWMKWPILTVLRWMSGRAAQSDTYFYGLTYSGKLFGRNAQKIRVPSYYNSVEVSSHPSAFLDASGGKHAIDYIFHSSPDRTREFETLMNKKFL